MTKQEKCIFAVATAWIGTIFIWDYLAAGQSRWPLIIALAPGVTSLVWQLYRKRQKSAIEKINKSGKE